MILNSQGFKGLLTLSLLMAGPTYGDETYFREDRVSAEVSTTKPISGPLCGHACLKIALDLLGTRVSMDELERKIPYRENGASIGALVKAAQRYGHSSWWFKKKELGDLFDDENDLLIIRIEKEVDGEKMKHFVLLIKRFYDRFVLVDPYDSTLICDMNALKDMYVGDGLRITKSGISWPSWGEAVAAFCLGYIALLIGKLGTRFSKKGTPESGELYAS